MKKILLTFMLALMAITAQAVTEFTVGSLKYYIETTGDAYCNGLAASAGNPTTITIPGRVTYNGTTYYVTNIATNAFKNNTTLKQVRVGWGVKQIGSASFMGCTALEYVWLPSSVSVMYNQAFQGCTSMLQFQIAAPTPPILYGDKTFYNMKKCDVVVAMQSNITAYGNSSQFVDADKNGSISAEGYAANDFINNGVAWVITNDDIKAINVNVTMVGISPTLTYLPMTSSTTDYTNATYGNGSSLNCSWTEIASYAADGRTALKTIGRSDSGSYFRLNKVGARAFEGCTGLTEVNISAAEIEESAFYNCTNLATVNLYLKGNESYGTQKLGNLCFANTAVTSQYIPSSLTSYGYGAFAMCSNLKTFSVSPSNQYFSVYGIQGNLALYNKGTTFLTLYQHPNAPVSLYSNQYHYIKYINPYAFAGVEYSITIPSGVTSIGSYAFYRAKCNTLLIPNSVTSFASTTFAYMKVNRLIFNKTDIPSSLTGSSTFNGVTNTSGGTSIRLSVPSACTNKYRTTSPWSTTFTTVDEKAYDTQIYESDGTATNIYITVMNYNSYTDPLVPNVTYPGQCKIVRGDMTNRTGYLNIPNYWFNKNYNSNTSFAITEIDREAFRDMTGITKVQGGERITKIGALAFAGLTGCTQGFNIPNPVEFGDSSLFNCWTPTITLGDRLERIGNDAFRYSAVRQVLMPPSVTSIGKRFIAGDTQLDTLRLSPNITEIPNQGLAWVNTRYIVIPYGVKKIGTQAFFSDKALIIDGQYLYETNCENVVVIPSSVTYIDPDAFKYARHLDAIFLNCPYGAFKTTSKNNWQRRTDYNADNCYDWSGHKLYVPVGQVQQYRNDPGIKAAWNENSDVSAGAFDFTTGNDFMTTMYRMTVVNPTTKTAKYVYNWGTGSAYINAVNTKTDHLTGTSYTMVEIGDSCWANPNTVFKQVSFSSSSTITRIGAYAFQNCMGLNIEVNVPESVNEIGRNAFYGCTNLPSVFLNRTGLTAVYPNLFTSSQQTILYVPLNRFYNIANQTSGWLANTASNRRLLPYVKPTTEWSAISVPVSDNILLPASGEFYYASSINSGNSALNKTQLTNSKGIKGGEGMLMKGTVGTVYRFRPNNAVSGYSYISPSTNLLKGATDVIQTLTYSSSGPYYYTFDGQKFNRVNSSATVYSGEAYVQTSSSFSNVYIESNITTYDLYINGTQVTSENCSNLKVISGVSGTAVSYNPTTKTLTLNNATISSTSNVPVNNYIAGLTIKVIGTNRLKTTEGNHIALQIMQNTTITGTGTLNAGSAVTSGCMVNTGKTLTINGGVQMYCVGYIYGIYGYSTSSRLVISGANTKLSAMGVTNGSYYQLVTTMNDGLAITSPAGAYFNSNGTVTYNGTMVKNQEVVISKPAVTRGDVDGNGSVNISDVTALIDYLLSSNAGTNASAADCNQDGSVNISDVTTLIDYLLSGAW